MPVVAALGALGSAFGGKSDAGPSTAISGAKTFGDFKSNKNGATTDLVIGSLIVLSIFAVGFYAGRKL